MAVGAVAAVTLTVALPYPSATSAAAAAPTARPTTGPATAPLRETLTPEQIDAVAALDLRRPLFDPPPAPPAIEGPTVAAAEPEPATLAGTVIEPGHSYAIFVTPAGTNEVRTVGESTSGREVLRIEDNQVTLRAGDRTTVVRVRKHPEDAAEEAN
jgi:hypothetical protein